MDESNNSDLNNKTLVISYIQLLFLLVISYQIVFVQGKQDSKSLEYENTKNVYEAVNLVEQERLASSNELVERLSLVLLEDDLLAQSIVELLSVDLKNMITEQLKLLPTKKNTIKKLTKSDSLSFDELQQEVDEFTASGNVSITSINGLFEKLGPLNKEQRQQVRQTIAMAINSGQINLIQ